MWFVLLAFVGVAEARTYGNWFLGGGVSYTFHDKRHFGLYSDFAVDEAFAGSQTIVLPTFGCVFRLRWTRTTDWTGIAALRFGAQFAPEVGDGSAFLSVVGTHAELGLAARGRGTEGGFVGGEINGSMFAARADAVLPFGQPTTVELPRRRLAMGTDERRPLADPTLGFGVAIPLKGVYHYTNPYGYYGYYEVPQ